MKILYLTDTHITAKTPSSRLDDIQEVLKSKFKEVGDIIKNENIEAVVHGGDMFHIPEVSNKFVGEISKIIRSYNVPFYVVPGNHDLQGQNEESLPHTKLGLLYNTGVINILNRKNPVIFDENGYSISFEGQEYHPNIDKEPLKDYQVINTYADFKVLVAHSMLLEREFHEGTVFTLIKDVQTKADLILAGHYHPGFKTQFVNGTWYINPGSLLRMEGSTHSIKVAKPKVVILDISKNGFSQKEVELSCAVEGTKVFSTKNLDKKGYGQTLANFNAKLKDIKLKDVDIVSLIDEYVKANPEDATIVNKAKNEIVKIQREQMVDNGYVPSNVNVAIDKLEIKNFQAHENISIDFVKGINTIVGESNAGKTAIMRAIRFALHNKPSGSDFITTGKKSCSVKVHLSNGFIIERKRSRSSAGSYILTKPDGTIQEYKGFKNNIPIDIINAHQMPELKIGGNTYSLNIATQLEPAFMVSASSTERLSLIGALVDTDRADAAKKVVASEKRALSASIKKTEEDRAKEVAKLSKYDKLDAMRVSVETLEMIDAKLDSDEQHLIILNDVKNSHNKLKLDIVGIDSKLSNISLVDRDLIDEFNNELDKLENLQDLSMLYKGAVFNISKINNDLSNMPAPIEDGNIVEFNKLLDEIKELVELKTTYSNLKDTLDNIELDLKSIPKLVSHADIEEYKKLYLELQTMVSLSDEYKKTSVLDFDFKYDLDTLKKLREEYVNNMKAFAELSKIDTELKRINIEISDIGERESELNKELNDLKVVKNERLEKLKSEVHICETCGSEVTADKLMEA